jgi:hypothetical protein
MFCRSFVVLLPFFLLAIVLSVLLRFTATGNTLGSGDIMISCMGDENGDGKGMCSQ